MNRALMKIVAGGAAGAAMENASDRLGAARARATEAIDHLAERQKQRMPAATAVPPTA